MGVIAGHRDKGEVSVGPGECEVRNAHKGENGRQN
jgi:hypothetical protein